VIQRWALVLLVSLVLAVPAFAQAPSVQPDDSLEKVIAAYKGKRVPLKLGPNDELTGVVKSVTANVVHLGELAGRKFFDAVVDVKRVQALVVRTRN
jgi:hypothetical protein